MTTHSRRGVLPAGAFAVAGLLALLGALLDGATSVPAVLSALVLPVVLLLIAVGLVRGSRVARTTAACAAPVVGTLALTSSSPWIPLLCFLLVLAAVAASVVVPDVRAHFAADRPALAPSIVVVRWTVATLAGISALVALGALLVGIGGVVGLSFFPDRATPPDEGVVGILLGLVSTLLLIVAIGIVAVHGPLAALGFWSVGALARRRVGARVLLTVVLSLALLVLISFLGLASGAVARLGAVLVTVHVVLLVLLWVPDDTRTHFGQRPLAAVDDVRRRLAIAPPESGWDARSPGPIGGPGSWNGRPPMPVTMAWHPSLPPAAAAFCAGCAQPVDPWWRQCPRCGAPLAPPTSPWAAH